MSMDRVGAGGAQRGVGFGSFGQSGGDLPSQRGSLTSGLSSADMAALKSAGVTLEGPETAISPTEAAITRPESLGGVGQGGQARAVTAAATGGQSLRPAQTAAPAEKVSTPPPNPTILPIPSLAEVLAAIGATGLQEGGTVPPGGVAVVGEAGPEVLQTHPTGGATVIPMTPPQQPQATPQATPQAPAQAAPQATPAAPTPETQPAQPSFARRALGVLGDVALGAALGKQGAAAMVAARQQQMLRLATMGITNPALLKVPTIADAVDKTIGAGTAKTLLDSSNPNIQARALAQAYGIPLLPGNEFQQFSTELQQRGFGLIATSKGELRVTQPPRPTEQQDALRALGDFNTVFQFATDQGMSEPQAAQAAAKRILAVAPQRGYVPPQWIQQLATATTDREIQTALEASKAAARKQVELRFAAPIAAASEAGRRQARLSTPISLDEVRARNRIVAAAVGGVQFSDKLTDDDLINAESQNLVLKQQPDGTFIGIPKNVVPNDALVLSPRELLSKRAAQKIATKTTTQQENARVIVDALDQIDATHALDLLTSAQPQAGGLTSRVLSALKTEAAGQVVGRGRLFAARRSPDIAEREKAIALINLGTLATNFVKSLGDVGAITEPDKAVFYQRVGRIADGVASQQEAASMLQQIRAMMMNISAIAGNKKLSELTPEEREQVKTVVSGALNGVSSVHTPPPGYQAVPGTGAFFSVTP
jgi:hypothetical protein